jgi:hypothetical protein
MHSGRERHYGLQADRVAQVRTWLESFVPAMEQNLANLKRRVKSDPQP